MFAVLFMIDDFIYKEMCELNADGVDFVPFVYDDIYSFTIYASYTKEEWKNYGNSYPKGGRKYWKLDENNKKIYLNKYKSII